MVAKIVNMVNLSKSHGIATLMHAHKCALVHLAHGVHAIRIALVAPSLAPSWSSAQPLVEVLNALTQLVTLRQLIATHMIAQMAMCALLQTHASTQMDLFSDDEVDIDGLAFLISLS